MGDERVTVQNLKVVAIDEEDGLILVRGGVPGSKNGWVLVSDAIKRPAPEGLPFPAGLKQAKVAEQDVKEEVKADEAPAEEAAAEEGKAE
jgi:large subunit ribosomal protein L3